MPQYFETASVAVRKNLGTGTIPNKLITTTYIFRQLIRRSLPPASHFPSLFVADSRPLVWDGGMTVLIASSSATAAPVATSTVAAVAQTKPKAMASCIEDDPTAS